MSQRLDNIFNVADDLQEGGSFPLFVGPGGTQGLAGTNIDTDVVSLVAMPGFDAPPPTLSVIRPTDSVTAWEIVNAAPDTGPAQRLSVFVKAVRGTMVDYQRVLVFSGANYQLLLTGGHGFELIYFTDASTIYVSAGDAFNVALACGFQHYYSQSVLNMDEFQPFVVTPNNEIPAWIAASTSVSKKITGSVTANGSASLASISLNLAGIAPNALGTYAFNVTSTGKPEVNPPQYNIPDATHTETTRIFVVVVPPDVLWKGDPFAANAVAESAFGWAYGDKVFAGSTVAISAGPSWLTVTGGTITGTPPVNPADPSKSYVVNVTLKATSMNVTQSVVLAITVAPPAVDLWSGEPFTATAIEGQPFTWSVANKVAPATTIYAAQNPAWLPFASGALNGTPPAGTGGTTIVVNLSAQKGSITSNTSLTITVAPPLAATEYWIGDPYTAAAVEGKLFSWSVVGRLAAGAGATLPAGAPAWLTLNGTNLVGTPPAGTGGTAVAVALRASVGASFDSATLTINIATPPPASMFTNAPYSDTITEAKQFTFQIAVAYTDVAVVATGLPPWLIFEPDTLTFSGMAPFGTGGSIVVIGLEGSYDGQTEKTSLTITITPLAVFGITLDLRNNTLTFTGGKPVFKHGDSAVLLVNCIPADQANGVTGLKVRLKDSYRAYGQLLIQTAYARIGTTNSFQFAALTFAGARLDHALALLDPVQVFEALDFMLEIEYAFNGNRKTSIVAAVTVARDFGLDTSAGGVGAPGGDSGDTETGGNAGAGSGALFTFNLQLAGDIVQGQSFGYFVCPTPLLITGTSIDIQAPDALAGMTVRLVDANGTAYGDAYGVTVGQNAQNAAADFSASSLALAAGSIVRAQVISYTPSADASAPAKSLTMQVTARQ